MRHQMLSVSRFSPVRFSAIARFSAVSLAAALALTTAGAGPASATTASRTAHSSHIASAAGEPHIATAMPSGQPILLIDGTRLSVASLAGHPAGVTVLPGGSGGLAGSVQSVRFAGQTYEFPAAALPYVGRGLDPSLFELSALRRIEKGGRLPVDIRYQGRLPKLPGVTVTSSSGGSAAGYLTASSARAFGAALDRQFVTDHPRASYGSDGLFAAGTSIALARTGVRARTRQAPVRPHYPMHTLTVTGTDLSGTPDTGDFIFVLNVDNPCRFCGLFTDQSYFYRGTAKFSAPDGHYFAFADFYDLSSGGQLTAERLVILSQFQVSGNTTVHVAERTARKLLMVTPRPAVPQATTLTLLRSTAAHAGFITIYAWNWHTAVPFWTSSAARPATGTLEAFTAQALASPAGARSSYEYNLIRRSIGAFDPRYVVPASSLATVATRTYQDIAANADASLLPLFPDELTFLPYSLVYPIHLPSQQTRYMTGNTSVLWFDGYAGSYNPRTGELSGEGQFSTGSIFSAGEHLSLNWNDYPLHNGLYSYLPGVAKLAHRSHIVNPVSASRTGNVLSVALTPFSDNQPGHYGTGLRVGPGAKFSGTYQIDQNGTKVAGGKVRPDIFGVFAALAKLGTTPSTVSLTFDAARTGPDFELSTSGQTTWTWRSAPAQRAKLPTGYYCASLLTAGTVTQDCAAQPLMTLGYAVPGLALNGSAGAGRQVLRLTVGHMQPAPATKITKATVQASFDGGKTWKTAQLTGQDGKYKAVFTAPAGSFVTLRVSAADANGGQITETIARAYRIASAARTSAADVTARSVPRQPLRDYPPTSQDPVLGPLRTACPEARPGYAHCFTLYASQIRVNEALAARAAGERVPASAVTPAGWGATALESAYKLPVSRKTHQTVAVVDAFSTPHLATDLGVYRKQYGLPACTAASGCLRIVNQEGKTSPLPRPDPAQWGVEETLDVAMVSAACPHCRILVVEAKSASFGNLATAEDTAASMGATVISNSYGAREDGFTQTYHRAYNHPGHVIVASSGDFGFGAANFPANLATVTAVGGTELAKAANARGWTETVWADGSDASGSGCSAYTAKPSWQHDLHCPGRTVADVSAVASNVAIYDSSIPKTLGGPWLTVSGTSAASPLIAGVYGLAGNAATLAPGAEYAHPGALYDVTTGNNVAFPFGGTCGKDYLCNAKKGYDAPTGLGTPDGIGDF